MWSQSSATLFLIFTSLEYLLRVSCGDPDVCATATNIGSYKRSTAYILGPVETPQCDQLIQNDAWYSFDAPTGSKMPETCVKVYQCGSMAPAWMNGTHPTAANPGPLTRSVCAQMKLTGTCCDWKSEIKVKWCQNATTKKEYFVYQLKLPPSCDISYCAGNRVKCNANCVWNDVISNCSCPVYPTITPPVLSEPFISATKSVMDARGGQFIATKFSINCTVGYAKQRVDDGARFFGVLLSNGNAIAKVIGTSLEPTLVFEEGVLHGYLGTNITCWASTYWMSSDPQYSAAHMSNSRWFGLQPVTEKGELITKAVIKDGEVFAFKIQANFPITSPKCFTNPPGVACHPTYTFSISANKAGRICDCRFSLTPFNNASDLITVSPAPIIASRVKPFIWEVAFGNQTEDQHTSGSIFEGYTIPSIKVQIEDSGTRPLCSSTGDPHITTFAMGPSKNRLYYNLYLSGDFSLVNATTRFFQIQVRQFPCSPSVSCNCGVMIREGNNILGIDSCQRGEGAKADLTPRLIRYLLDQESPGGQIETTGSGWTIMMLSGVVINVDRGYKDGVLDIHVIGLSSETYSGLCTYTGTQTASCTTDCEKYRVSEKDSFFNYNSSNIPKCQESYVVPTCDCHRKDGDNSINVTCSQPNQSNLLKTNYRCEPPPEKKTNISKPPVDDNDTVHIDVLGKDKIPIITTRPNVVPVWPTPINKINESKAKQECNSSLVSSDVYALCRARNTINFAIIIEACVLDIQLADDLSPARSVKAQLERICVYELEISRNVTINGPDPSTKDLDDKWKQIQERICPNQCWNRGKCVKSSCVCDSGYIGSDCFLPKGYVPAIVDLLSPDCVISATMSCGKIFVQTKDVLSGYNVSCKIENTASETKLDSRPIVSGGIVICPLLFQPSPGTYNVSISIDGLRFSVEKQYTISPSVADTLTTTFKAARTTPKLETIPPNKPPTTPKLETIPPNKAPTTVDTTSPESVACPVLTEVLDEFQQCLNAIRKKRI